MAAKWVLFACLTLVHVDAFSDDQSGDSRVAVVSEFLAAFNAQDAAGMGTLVTEDIKWLSVANGETSIEVEGRSSLVTAMAGYFSACPSCRSSISKMMPSRDRVSVIEVASWESDGVRKSQQAMAVYEFSGSKIAAVYYFPAEPVSLPEDESSQE